MTRLTNALEKLANAKPRRSDFNKQSYGNSNFSNKNDSNQTNWRKNGNQPKRNSANIQNNGQKSIHVVQEQQNETKGEEVEHENANDSDSSENYD